MDPAPAPPTSPETGGLARWFAENRGAGWAALVVVMIWGAVSLVRLPQQEDPALPGRLARIVCVWPGASAQEIETRVAQPLERRVSALDSMQDVATESRDSVCVLTIGQHPARPQIIQQEWDALRASLAHTELPAGCQPPRLHTEFGDVVTLLLAVSNQGGADDRQLTRAARDLADALRGLADVGRVELLGTVGERVEVSAEIGSVTRPLDLPQLADRLSHFGQPLPGASLHTSPIRLPVRLEGDPPTEAGLRALAIDRTPEGKPVRLDQVLAVRRTMEPPRPLTTDVFQRTSEGRLTARRSVMVAVEMRSGRAIRHFDQAVREVIDERRSQLANGVTIETISDQPRSVESRLDRFQRCFLEAVAVILVVAVMFMEWRAAVVVALAIPLTLAMTFGGMAVAGIPLHQVSIAALIISLGMLVDDPVVAADGINRELAAGTPRIRAAWLGPWKLRRPIFFATLINVFAFLPLLLLPGDKRSFIHALPVVVSLSLVCSRVVSMTFVPLLGRQWLRGQAGLEQGAPRRPFPWSGVDRVLAWLLRPYRTVLNGSLRRPWLALLVAYCLLSASLTLAPRLGRQFFPAAERNQFLIDLSLPEGSSLERTREVCAQALAVLDGFPEVVEGAQFAGGSAPRFYYNVTPKAPASHLAQIVVTTREEAEVPGLVNRLRDALDHQLSGARCVVRRLEQGPPVEAPIQIRLTGPDRAILRSLADIVDATLQKAGAYKVNDTLGQRVPVIDIGLDPSKAAPAGVTAGALAAAVQAAGPGLELTRLRENDEDIPVVFRWVGPNAAALTTLDELPLPAGDGSLVPLQSVTRKATALEFPALQRHHGTPSVSVEALAPGNELPAAVLDRARPHLDSLELPPGYRLSYEGEARELVESRREMGSVMAVSLGLIALTLIIQFRSVGRAMVVMLTVPLGMIGALAGLTIAQVPLGFMAMLACVSLAGVIVSHIIVLSDAVEEARAAGAGIHEALVAAGLTRLRPVLVTTLATAGGLVPLALTGGALWKPLAAVHIAGLLVATSLTLLVLPVWYSLIVRSPQSDK